MDRQSAIIVEFTGVTGVGKTTLVTAVKSLLSDKGFPAEDAYEVILKLYRLNFVRHPKLRSVLIDFLAFFPFLRYISTSKGLEILRLALHAIYNNSETFIIAANLLRNFIKRIGVYCLLKQIKEKASRSQLNCDFIICDEGILHVAHNLFVHTDYPPDLEDIIKFSHLVPQPDIVIWVTADLEKSIQCTLERGHKRVKHNLEEARTFVEHGYLVFNTLFSTDLVANNFFKIDCSDNSQKVDNHSLYHQAALSVTNFLKTKLSEKC